MSKSYTKILKNKKVRAENIFGGESRVPPNLVWLRPGALKEVCQPITFVLHKIKILLEKLVLTDGKVILIISNLIEMIQTKE